MAEQAERAEIGKVALPSAFRHRQNVIGIPQRFPAGLAQTPILQKLPARRVVEFAHVPPQRVVSAPQTAQIPLSRSKTLPRR